MRGTEEMASEEGVTEEARRPMIAKRPQTPTMAEYDAHMNLHADYRDWCPDCMQGEASATSTDPRGMRGQEGNSVWITLS